MQAQAIELIFDRRLRTAGEIAEGEVILHFPELMAEDVQEVDIKLCGGVVT